MSLVVCEAAPTVPHPESGSCDDRVLVGCSWWALCENAATMVRLHPILGPVPICDRCQALVEGMS